MAAKQQIVVLNQRQLRPRSLLVYVHYLKKCSPLATMSEDTILQKFCLPQEQTQQLLQSFLVKLSRDKLDGATA